MVDPSSSFLMLLRERAHQIMWKYKLKKNLGDRFFEGQFSIGDNIGFNHQVKKLKNNRTSNFNLEKNVFKHVSTIAICFYRLAILSEYIMEVYCGFILKIYSQL